MLALKPELIRRRKRIELPRSPERPLGAKARMLDQPVRIPDEELKALLEQLVSLAERETLFTSTLEPARLIQALAYGGYAFEVFLNVENQIAPGATVTTYLPVAPGYTYIASIFEYWNSLPWWLTSAAWIDSDLPAPPQAFWVRTPDHLIIKWEGIAGIHRFLRYTITNNHAVNTANFCASHDFAIVTDDTWKMIEEVYKAPLIDYVRELAERKTGRPFP